MDWRERVKGLMQQKNISQKELAELSGINPSSVSRYLNQNKRPRMDVVVNFAKALGVSTDFLLGEDEQLESAYETISNAIARKGEKLSEKERNELVLMLLKGNNA